MQFLRLDLNLFTLLFLALATQVFNVASQLGLGAGFSCRSIERPVPVCRLAKLNSIGYAYSVQIARANQLQSALGGYANGLYNCAGSNMFGYPADNAACCDRYLNWRIAQVPGRLDITSPIFDEHCSRIGL